MDVTEINETYGSNIPFLSKEVLEEKLLLFFGSYGYEVFPTPMGKRYSIGALFLWETYDISHDRDCYSQEEALIALFVENAEKPSFKEIIKELDGIWR